MNNYKTIPIGDYFFIVGKCDAYDFAALERIHDYAVSNDYDMLCFTVGGGALLPENKIERIKYGIIGFGNANIKTVWNKLVKKQIYEKIEFGEEAEGEDCFITCQMLYYSQKIGYFSENFYQRNKEFCENIFDRKKNFMRIIEFCKKKFGNDLSVFEPDLTLRMSEIYSRSTTEELIKLSQYSYKYGVDRTLSISFYEYIERIDFEGKYLNLIEGLDEESICTVNRILAKIPKVKNTVDQLDIYTPKEQKRLKKLHSAFFSQICRISDNLWAYKKYLLPINHFEVSVFRDKHGIKCLQNTAALENKDIIDAGGFIGDSSLILSPLTKKNVYSFEGVKESYDLMQKTLVLNKVKNVVPVNCALGAQKEVLKINVTQSKSASSFKTPLLAQLTGKESVNIISIDDYVKENNLDVGLIKTDIEGFEPELLKGAFETIKKFKPALLISIYHNPNDFFEIKPLIQSWNLGYTFKVFKPFDGKIILETLLIAEVPADEF